MANDLRILKGLFDDFSLFDELSNILTKDSFNISLYNVIGASSALIISRFIESCENILVITNSDNEAGKVYANLNELLPEDFKEKLLLFPDANIVPYEKISPPIELVSEQINVLSELISSKQNIVISTVRALFNPVISRKDLSRNILKLSVLSEINLIELKERLLSYGYSPEVTVERVGDVSFRGGIIDIFSPSNRFPLRVEFIGNTISSIRFFDPSTQLSTGKVQAVEILPVSYLILNKETSEEIVKNVEAFIKKNGISLSDILVEDIEKIKSLVRFSGIEHFLPFTRKEESTLLSYMDDDSIVFTINLPNAKEAAKALKAEANEIYEIENRKKEILPLNFNKYINDTERKLFALKRVLKLESLPLSKGCGNKFALPLKAAESLYSSDFKGVINSYLASGGTVFIASKQKNRVKEILEGFGFDLSAQNIIVKDLYLSEGFSFPTKNFTLLTDKELFGWKGVHKHFKRFKESIPIKSIEDLKEGDILVHYNYGIGIYRGLVVVPDAEGNDKEYLLMEYAKGDKLYVPPERINMVNKYVGDAESFTLSRLGGAEWERVRERVKKGTKEIAEELLKLYAKREISQGRQFSKDTPWQHELELSFPYEETPDQLKAINDVKMDMEEKKIMDRIVTGDVGYGKTEVAIRSAFKAIMDGFQVALLVPTTILANQHYETFKERFTPFPVEISLLSRLVPAKLQKKVIEDIREGKVDLVIGTHKLLSSEITFKKLGLLIIDEEHKFGVKQKERIKKLKEDVEVLTLTATPIPRTLSMTISGIKEISHINTSPEGRKPVKTYVMPYDPEVVRDAVKFELTRGGQVYYVHNRINDIERVKGELLKFLPDVKIGIAHGRMLEDEIDEVMTSFLKGDINLLLCTTIIESGIDIPTVNTIIIDDADRLGLAQLYQLRGRVGRSNRRAYAYFLYPTSKPLEEKARLRLDAIKNFVELGSGLKVALRDLEIRGAGNFLGSEQHGHMKAVGYHLYVQLLKEAIYELKEGNNKKEKALPEFPLAGYIPSFYIRDDGERLSAYQELVSSKNLSELKKLEDEYCDKYGKPPNELKKFYNNLELRLIAFEKGLSAVKLEEGLIFFNFDNERLNVKVENISKLVKKFGNKIRFKPDAIILRKEEIEFNEAVREVMECL
jgi:transcription-repair coupling factor (superfamily II helicase)